MTPNTKQNAPEGSLSVEAGALPRTGEGGYYEAPEIKTAHLQMTRGWQEEDRLQCRPYYIGFGGREQADLPFLNGPWHSCETTRAFLGLAHTAKSAFLVNM